jgi:pimeloyl-ACP methyl ester carboxylesterase
MSEFIRTVVNAPVHVIAESAGAAAGCWLALLEPSVVQSLVLVAPTAFAGDSHAPPPGSPEAMELRLFGSKPAWTEPPTDADRAARQRNSRANAASIRPAHGNAELRERLGEITVSTLVLWGTADELVPPESGQLFLRSIPNSYRILIYGAAHALPVSACRQFVELVSDFIERGDGFVVAEPFNQRG